MKGLDFGGIDISLRLVEWIELIHLLGASKIYFYLLNVTENTLRVLHYYQKTNIVDVITTTYPPTFPSSYHDYSQENIASRRYFELMTYNDCFYTNMYR